MTKEKKDHPVIGGTIGTLAGAGAGLGLYSQHERPTALAYKISENLKKFQGKTNSKLWRTMRSAEQKRIVNALRGLSKVVKEHPAMAIGGAAILGGAFGAGMGKQEIKGFNKEAGLDLLGLAQTGKSMFKSVAGAIEKKVPALAITPSEALKKITQKEAAPIAVKSFNPQRAIKRTYETPASALLA